MGILEREMKRLAQQAGGAHKTVSDRMAQGMDKRTLQNEMAMIDDKGCSAAGRTRETG